MKALGFFALGAIALVACGGSVSPAPSDAGVDDASDSEALGDAEPSEAAPSDATDAPDGDPCWRCADRAWRNVCVVPAQRAPDAESCLHCGEHCDSGDP